MPGVRSSGLWYSQTMAGGVRRPSPPGGDTLALLDQESSGEIVSHATYARELRRRLPARCFGPVPARLWWLVPHLAVIVLGIAWIGMDHLGWLPSLGLALLRDQLASLTWATRWRWLTAW